MSDRLQRPLLVGPPAVVRAIHLAVTLLFLFGVTWLSTRASPPYFGAGRITILVGFVLLVASLAGALASSAGLPRLTGFLVVGIVAGPSVLGVVPPGAVAELSLIDEFALALIAMLAGGELKVEALRPQARAILLATLSVTGIVWVGMTVVVLGVRPLVPFLSELPLVGALGVALLLGVWAANSSPDLTVGVIEETGSTGTLTDVILGITIVKDVLVIVLFTLTLALARPLIEGEGGFGPEVLAHLAQEVGGALLLGAALGWVFSRYLGGEDAPPRPPMATFLFAYVLVVVANRLHVELLLAGVAAGFVIENLSPAGDRMIRGIRSVSVVIFAFFFAIAGASLDLGAVRTFWHAALVLFSARLLLTWLGARQGLRWAGAGAALEERTWQGLVSQGGVTLGLVLVLAESFPGLGPGVVALGMAVILGNILGGPVLLKRALTAQAGEERDAEAAPAGRPGA